MDKDILTTKQKEAILDGKRYKIITESLKGRETPHDLLIDLHYAWYETMQSVRRDLLNG